jgi:hypothetical protein
VVAPAHGHQGPAAIAGTSRRLVDGNHEQREFPPLLAFLARLVVPNVAILAHCVEHFPQERRYATPSSKFRLRPDWPRLNGRCHVNEKMALNLVCRLMGWDDGRAAQEFDWLRLMASVKYDGYAEFRSGVRFLENLVNLASSV